MGHLTGALSARNPSRRRHAAMRAAAILAVLLFVATAGLAGCDASSGSSKAPPIFQPGQFLWETDDQIQIDVPLTNDEPAPTAKINAHHSRGFGGFVEGDDLLQAAKDDGDQVLAAQIDHMQSAGWRALYAPRASSAFPSYVAYVTFRANSHYCFVEYRVAELDGPTPSQTLDIYSN